MLDFPDVNYLCRCLGSEAELSFFLSEIRTGAGRLLAAGDDAGTGAEDKAGRGVGGADTGADVDVDGLGCGRWRRILYEMPG